MGVGVGVGAPRLQGHEAGNRPSPAAWSSASCSSGFCESPPPCPWTVLAGCARQAGTWGGCSWTPGHRLGPRENSCGPGGCWAGPGGHPGDGLGGGLVLSMALQPSDPPCLDKRWACPPPPPPGGLPAALALAVGTHCMETVETAEGILPMPPLSTSSMACFISILW